MSLAHAVIVLAAASQQTVLFEPVPAWVVPGQPVASSDASMWRLVDRQQRIDHGEIWQYLHLILHVTSPSQLAQAGNFTIEWSPDHGRAIVHGLAILRDGKRIDVLASGAKFDVLRREKQLEAQTLDGQLSATMQIPDVRVGDTIDIEVSVTETDKVLQGHASASVPLLAKPVEIGGGRVRVLWRDEDRQRWKIHLAGASPSERQLGGWHELVVPVPLPKQPDVAPEAPGRFAQLPLLETTDFADWREVSRTMAPLFDPAAPSAAITPGGDLDRAIGAIAAASTDPRRRMADALQLVQDKIRYFAVVLGNGNFTPQSPEQTWSRRYGDCKAKTMLLLAIFHKLEIAAEPALANLPDGDIVQNRLPSMNAFNHVFVLAHAGGKDFWLDGTGSGTRIEDLDDVPDYHWVLPLRASGADLLQAHATVPARPQFEKRIADDLRGGMQSFAARHVEVTLRGAGVSQIDSQLAGLDAESRADLLRQFLNSSLIAGDFVRPQFNFDRVTGTARIIADGVYREQWKRADRRYTFDPALFGKRNFPDRSRSIWQAIPMTTQAPIRGVTSFTVLLPSKGVGFAMEGLPLDVAETGSSLKAELANGEWRYVVTGLADGHEEPAARLPELRKSQADFYAKAPTLRTVADYPPGWKGIAEARRNHFFDRTIALLNQRIAEKPEDPERLWALASFYDSIHDREQAIAAYSRLIAIKADKGYYRARAALYISQENDAAAEADLRAAYAIDPSDIGLLGSLSFLLARTGKADDALQLVDAAMSGANDKEADYLAIKAEVLTQRGDGDGAIAAIDAALEKHPNRASLLNARCWLKGLLNRDLASAAQDCTRAIQQSETGNRAALDSRGLIRLRQGDYAGAIADLDAALDLAPSAGNSYFLRALAERAAGKMEAAKADLEADRILMPAIPHEYARFGLIWKP